MKLRNPFSALRRGEWALWIFSLIVVTTSFCLVRPFDPLTLIASLIGVTALIFVSRGDVFGQILTVVFAVFYGIISYLFSYYGEMITYLCMTSPIAILSVISWLRHPFEDQAEVEVNRLRGKHWILLLALSAIVSVMFYFILRSLGNANLLVSTLSVTTSFLASALTMLRSPYYALAYAANDVVLIVLWILASAISLSYLPMVFCFLMFLINDTYGFFNWQRMQRRQARAKNSAAPLS